MSELSNFRVNKFHLFGQDLTIAGMAGPHNNPNVDTALAYLRNVEKRSVLIGLHENKNFTSQSLNNGIEYYHVPISDGTTELNSKPIDVEIYDNVYNIIKQATKDGKKIAIHCGAGDGRTGTALAALKLRELLETAAAIDPTILDQRPENTTTVYSEYLCMDFPSTPLVKNAIEIIRTQREEKNENGAASVETENDINSLIQYEKHLRVVIKQELMANKPVEIIEVSPAVSRPKLGSR